MLKSDDIWLSILQFLFRKRGAYKIEFSRETELLSDLGIDGDDAVEFLEDFSKEFSVDVSHLEFDKYFNQESLDSVNLISSIFSKKKRKMFLPITLGMLEECSKKGQWDF